MASMAVETLKITVSSRLDAGEYVSDQGLELRGCRIESSPMVSCVNFDEDADLESSYLRDRSHGV